MSRVLDRMKKLAEFGEMIDLDRNNLHFKPRVIKWIQVKVERFLQLFLLLTYVENRRIPFIEQETTAFKYLKER